MPKRKKPYSMPPEWQGQRGVRRLRDWERRPRQLSLDTFLAGYCRTMSRLSPSQRRMPAEADEWASGAAWRMATEAVCWAGFPDYETLRRLIYRRDRGRCWRCRHVVPWCQYNLGHIIDNRFDGPMLPSNLAVMCKHCNVTKPWHRTREEAEAWRKGEIPAERTRYTWDAPTQAWKPLCPKPTRKAAIPPDASISRCEGL